MPTPVTKPKWVDQPWVTDADIKATVAAAVGVEVADLADKYDLLVSESNESAVNEIVTALSEKGFTWPQIDSWDRVREFNKHLALFWVGSDAGFLTAYSPQWVDRFDRREELAAMKSITINGAIIYPASKTSDGGGTQVTGGELTGSVPRRDWTQTEF